MNNKIKKFSDGVLIGIGIAFILGLVGVVSAAWENIIDAVEGGALTSAEWNKVLDNQRYLKQEGEKELTYMFVGMSGNQSYSSDVDVHFNDPIIEKGLGSFNSTNYTFTAGETGVYDLIANISFGGGVPAVHDPMYINIYVNGVSRDTIQIEPAVQIAVGYYIGESINSLLELNSGDTVKVRLTSVNQPTVVDSTSRLIIKQLP